MESPSPSTSANPAIPASDPNPAALHSRWLLGLGILAAVAGITLRLITWRGFNGQGFDESLYVHYLKQLIRVGLGGYPDIVDSYIAYQKTLEGSVLPPTRFLYIFAAYLWHGLFGGEPIACFHAVSRLFSVATLLAAGGFLWRLLPDRRIALAAFALLAFSPLQIHFSQHALVDGFFEFWALLTLWSLWENLQRPNQSFWLTVYTGSLALMVTCKENSFFVFVAIIGLLTTARFFRFGTVNRALLVTTVIGPVIGVAILTNLAGGLGTLIGVYRLGVSKNMHLAYAILTGDGPWYRYLVDLLLMSPLVLLLAAGTVFQLRRADRCLWFLVIFCAASYALMCNVKYGMNLRYASIWDLPIRTLAATQIAVLASRAGEARRGMVFVAGVVLLCGFDLYQYYRLAVLYPLYELVPQDLQQALYILKFPPK